MHKVSKIIVLSLLLSASSAQQAVSDWTSGCIAGIIGTLAVQATIIGVTIYKAMQDQAQAAAEKDRKHQSRIDAAMPQENNNRDKIKDSSEEKHKKFIAKQEADAKQLERDFRQKAEDAARDEKWRDWSCTIPQ